MMGAVTREERDDSSNERHHGRTGGSVRSAGQGKALVLAEGDTVLQGLGVKLNGVGRLIYSIAFTVHYLNLQNRLSLELARSQIWTRPPIVGAVYDQHTS